MLQPTCLKSRPTSHLAFGRRQRLVRSPQSSPSQWTCFSYCSSSSLEQFAIWREESRYRQNVQKTTKDFTVLQTLWRFNIFIVLYFCCFCFCCFLLFFLMFILCCKLPCLVMIMIMITINETIRSKTYQQWKLYMIDASDRYRGVETCHQSSRCRRASRWSRCSCLFAVEFSLCEVTTLL